MNKEESLFDKMKTMSAEELTGFYSTSRTIGGILHVAGISLILLMLLFPNIVVLTLLGIGTYIVSQFAVGIDEAKAYITKLLEEKYKINS
jgi:hypothetical protein